MYLMLMKNGIQVHSELNQVISKFDLKGSMIGRSSLPDLVDYMQQDQLKRFCKQNVLKDKDFIYLQKFRFPELINISKECKRDLIEAIEADAKFLRSQGMMDYSLLLAVEKKAHYIKAEEQDLLTHKADFIAALKIID